MTLSSPAATKGSTQIVFPKFGLWHCFQVDILAARSYTKSYEKLSNQLNCPIKSPVGRSSFLRKAEILDQEEDARRSLLSQFQPDGQWDETCQTGVAWISRSDWQLRLVPVSGPCKEGRSYGCKSTCRITKAGSKYLV